MSDARHASLDRLGRAIAERQDALRADAGTKEEARRALFARPSIPGLRAPRWPRIAFAAAALIAVLWILYSGDEGVVTAGQTFTATDAAQALRFIDGSEVRIEPGSKVRVDRADDRGAALVLERGSLFASIVKAPDARWSFGAGDYLVTVTGTAFDLNWAPPELSIVMHEGSVVVSGPGLGNGQRVVAGERAVFPLRRERAESAPKRDGEPHEEERAVTPKRSPSVASATAEGWQARAARGDHDGAFEVVAPRLDSELSSLDAASLVRLATVARLSGHPHVAQRVYLTLRERFPGTSSAAEAAFSLGTMAFGSSATEAERWFRLALVEAPGSGLAASARGRLLELAIRRGDAKAAAEDYLRHHPDGPHAALARDTLAP